MSVSVCVCVCPCVYVCVCVCAHLCVCASVCAAGLQSVVAAEMPLTVDRTPPIPGRVYNGAAFGTDARYQSSPASFCVNWARFSDPHSGLGRMVLAVGKGTL